MGPKRLSVVSVGIFFLCISLMFGFSSTGTLVFPSLTSLRRFSVPYTRWWSLTFVVSCVKRDFGDPSVTKTTMGLQLDHLD